MQTSSSIEDQSSIEAAQAGSVGEQGRHDEEDSQFKGNLDHWRSGWG